MPTPPQEVPVEVDARHIYSAFVGYRESTPSSDSGHTVPSNQLIKLCEGGWLVTTYDFNPYQDDKYSWGNVMSKETAAIETFGVKPE